MGSSCKTCGTALPPWHRTYAHSGSYSAGRKTHSRESRLWRSLRSTYPSAARAPSAFPSPCRKDAPNISNVTCFEQNNHYYHGLLGATACEIEDSNLLQKASAYQALSRGPSSLSQRKLVIRPPMNTAVDQFFSFVESERTSHVKRLRFAALMCILILSPLYRAEWLILRPGLLIVFAGQAGVAVAL